MTSKKRSIEEIEDNLPERPEKRRLLDSLQLSYPSTSTTVPPIQFQQPSSLLTFSYTPSRTLEFTNSALRYYVGPPADAELGYGYDRWIRRPEEKGRLDGLLKAVARVRSKMNASGADGTTWLKNVGVVSWRGVMTKILTAPYEERDGWEMNVMDIDGTLYLEEHLTDKKLEEKNDIAPHHRTQMYYGYSFESWCTSSSPHSGEALEGHPKGWGGDVDTNVQWCSVVKTKLGDLRMVIGGEVDCVRGKFTGQPDTFIELKTSIAIRRPQDEARFEKKLLKFYFQSFLLGVPEIMVGFRTPSGRITTLQSFKTIQIPRLVRGKSGAWDPLICLDWGHRFLTHLKSVVHSENSITEESPGTHVAKRKVWRVKFSPRDGVEISLLNGTGVDDVEAGEERIGFVPKWYWEEIHTTSQATTCPTQPVKTTTGTTLGIQGWKL